MTPAAAFLSHVLKPRAAMVLGPLILGALLAALLAALLWSVLEPALAVPELSPTRWYTPGTRA